MAKQKSAAPGSNRMMGRPPLAVTRNNNYMMIKEENKMSSAFAS